MQDVSPYMSPLQLGDIATAADDTSMSTLNVSLGLNPLQDDDDNTVTRERHDARVLRLQEEDDNYEGDGGTSDGEGEGYDVVQGFRDDMKASNVDRLMNGEEDVEVGIMDTDDNQSPSLVAENERHTIISSLYGAPPGWKPPSPEETWPPKPRKNTSPRGGSRPHNHNNSTTAIN